MRFDFSLFNVGMYLAKCKLTYATHTYWKIASYNIELSSMFIVHIDFIVMKFKSYNMEGCVYW